MSLIKQKQSPLSKWMTDFFDNESFFGFPPLSEEIRTALPATNVKETENDFQLELVLPGIKKDEIHIEIRDHVLNVSGESKEEKAETEGEYQRREFRKTSFSRSFRLPEHVQEEAIQAKYEDGILHLSLPKQELAEAEHGYAKKINIS